MIDIRNKEIGRNFNLLNLYEAWGYYGLGGHVYINKFGIRDGDGKGYGYVYGKGYEDGNEYGDGLNFGYRNGNGMSRAE
jgi:hypothetical protein